VFDAAQNWSGRVMIAAAIAAVAVVLAFYPMTADRGVDLRRRMGPADWDFRTSWAANLTVFSAAIGTIFAANLLPTGIRSSVTTTFVALNVLFGLAAVVGPFVYIVLQRRVAATRIKARTATETTQYQGTLGGFLLATTVVLWAVFGEFATAAQLLRVTHGKHAIPPDLVAMFGVLLAVAALLVVVYLGTRIRAIVDGQPDDQPAFAAKLRGVGIAEDDLPGRRPVLPAVPVL
jgi:hypothetical protein